MGIDSPEVIWDTCKLRDTQIGNSSDKIAPQLENVDSKLRIRDFACRKSNLSFAVARLSTIINFRLLFSNKKETDLEYFSQMRIVRYKPTSLEFLHHREIEGYFEMD